MLNLNKNNSMSMKKQLRLNAQEKIKLIENSEIKPLEYEK
jgi:hypothetical protein